MAQETLDQILNNHVIKLNGNEVVGDTKDKLAGAAFVVVSKDQVLYQGAAGYVSLPDPSSSSPPQPFSVSRSFTWIASMTKIVTSTCLMQLFERGLIGLDDDVREIVPELGQMQILAGFEPASGKPILLDNTKPITLRNLLTHTVGLGYDIADPDLLRWSQAVGRTTTNLTFTLEGWNTPLKFAPGEGWYYGSAIDWAGQVLERVTGGQTLEGYMADSIFGALDLQHTTFHSESILSDDTIAHKVDCVACTSRDPTTGALVQIPLPVPTDPPIESGGAGLWTTAADYSKILQALLKSTASDDDGILLSKKSVDEMFRPQLNETQHGMLKALTDMFHDGMVPEFPPGHPINHGLGGIINTEDVPGKRKKGSMMWQGMAGSKWWIDPETGIAAALIVNVINDADPGVRSLYNELELAVYSQLVPGWEKTK